MNAFQRHGTALHFDCLTPAASNTQGKASSTRDCKSNAATIRVKHHHQQTNQIFPGFHNHGQNNSRGVRLLACVHHERILRLQTPALPAHLHDRATSPLRLSCWSCNNAYSSEAGGDCIADDTGEGRFHSSTVQGGSLEEGDAVTEVEGERKSVKGGQAVKIAVGARNFWHEGKMHAVLNRNAVTRARC